MYWLSEPCVDPWPFYFLSAFGQNVAPSCQSSLLRPWLDRSCLNVSSSLYDIDTWGSSTTFMHQIPNQAWAMPGWTNLCHGYGSLILLRDWLQGYSFFQKEIQIYVLSREYIKLVDLECTKVEAIHRICLSKLFKYALNAVSLLLFSIFFFNIPVCRNISSFRA